MPSHFSTIGLPVATQQDFLGLANRVATDCVAHDTPLGQYLCWRSSTGAELWLQVDADGELIGMNPHFAGESVVAVGLTHRVARSDDTALDGAFHGWAAPEGDDFGTGTYPFVFDAPDFRLHDHRGLPALAVVQVAAFAREVSLFATPDAFDAAPAEPGRLRFASKSFIPSGLFSEPGDKSSPSALGIFTGHIRKAERRTNDLTGHPFWWALVDSLGGSFDVVIDPELIEVAPAIGGVLTGRFWLSGRLTPSEASFGR